MKPKILVVDDEPDVVRLIEFNLKAAGYDVITAEDGAEGLQRARSASPDLIVLDLMLPEVEGLEVCKLLRRDPATAQVPIIILTAKAAEVDRILGLELGADDYVTKPFSPRELVLRVKKRLQRQAEDKGGKPDTYAADDLMVDLPRHVVTVQDQPVELTATEFKLLHFLAQRPGWVFTRQQILDGVHGDNYAITDRAVDVQIVGLRKKLGEAGKYIETVRGVGYRFKE